jgi:membrane protein
MAYAALFSLFAALTIGWTVFVAVLGSRTDLQRAVLAQIDSWVPGLVGTGERAVLSPADLVLDSPVTVASVVALGVLVFSASAFMAALRTSVQAMFDVPPAAQNPVVAKLRELGGFVLLGVAVLLSAGASIVVTGLGGLLGDLLGLAVALVIDAGVVALAVVLVAGVRPPRRDLVVGSLVAAAVFGALRYVGTSVVVGASSRNALLASFAVVVTLLVLVNFVARVLLLVCAWIADPPQEPGPGTEGDRTPSSTPAGGTGEPDRRPGARWSAEERVRSGQGRGRPWSPVVRGVRRGRRADRDG